MTDDADLATAPDMICDLGRRAPRDWARIARLLVGATLAYNVVEAAVAIGTGIRAGSVALFGFGLDSVIECAAGVALLLRLGVKSGGERAEERVRRFVGLTFLLLALYVTGQAVFDLSFRRAPEESRLGIALAALSLAIMPFAAWGKFRAARGLGSAALRAEAKETLACSYLSLALLVGLVANAAGGLWWADPVAALAMVPWLIKEGIEGLRAEGCACAGAGAGERRTSCAPAAAGERGASCAGAPDEPCAGERRS